MNCFVHTSTAAVGLCALCQKATCTQCVARQSPRLICRECEKTRASVGFEFKSQTSIGDWPLVHICFASDAVSMRPKVARGIIAIGGIAMGVFTWGGLSIGLVSIGGLSIGLLLAIGGAAIGCGVSMGGFALGTVAVGGAAVGFKYAMGGAAIAPNAIDAAHCEEAARQFFRSWMPLPPRCRP